MKWSPIKWYLRRYFVKNAIAHVMMRVTSVVLVHCLRRVMEIGVTLAALITTI